MEDEFGHNIAKIFAIFLLRDDGTRIYSKYYTKICSKNVPLVVEGDLNNFDAQREFEKNIHEKSKKLTSSKTLNASENEIFTYSHFNAVFKTGNGACIFVIGEYDENELLLSSVLSTLYDALSYFCKGSVSKKSVMENFETLILLIDEIVDEGIVITVDYVTVIARATMKDTETIKLASQDASFSNVFEETRKKLINQLNS